MVTVFGFQINLPDALQFLNNVFGSFIATVIVWILIALFIYLVFKYPLKWLVHKIPGEIDDIILGIIHKPMFFLIIIFGSLNSLEVFKLSSSTTTLLERIANSALTIIVAYLIWRLLVDVFVHYGESWVQETESRVDDIILPIVRLFGTLIIGIVTLIVVLTLWGIDVTSVLVGAGVLGLVLGLALQDTLSNIFSGISLLIDAPFRIGDLITLPDGKICMVEKIGIRATQLYHLDEHSALYMPNKELASIVLANITRPTVDLKVTIEIGVAYNSNLETVREVLEEIANAHPNVLGNIKKKLEVLSKDSAPSNDKQKEIIEKMNKELAVNQYILSLIKELHEMKATIRLLEKGGLTPVELQQIQAKCVVKVEQCMQQVTKALSKWSALPDPNLSEHPDEEEDETKRWERQNSRLMARWGKFKDIIKKPVDKEMKLDDLTQDLISWIGSKYKILTEAWKAPQVTFNSFGPSSVDLKLDFYVDDIRLEHFERKQRVVTEIATAIHKRFQKEGIEIPFPQMDLRFKERGSLEGGKINKFDKRSEG